MADLRSDTVTKPSEAMRQLISHAEVGDDVLGDDPTVKSLEKLIAGMLGKEAAVFLPSGTMSNAVALRTHTQPGDEIVVEKSAHIYVYEGGGYAALCGVSIALVEGDRGRMTPLQVSEAVRKSAGSLGHFPNGSLVCIENTCNRGGGTCYEQSEIDKICATAHELDCKVHMDGARLFNAVTYSGVSAKRMVRDCDTVSICLSKGLGAPVGSLLVGDLQSITEARRWRKMFGGGMRQAGVLAAAGIYALENNIALLEKDHNRCRELAENVNRLSKFSVDLDSVQTNMVYINTNDPAEKVVELLSAKDIEVLQISDNTIRAVFHLDVGDDDLNNAISAFKTIDVE
ncbi:MAG TPA: hypothetical protein EYQ53_04465 [Candidatus Poseidoniales archaeon]|nr:MAG: hypothetical protein CXT68_04585 [Euryarchaeota archaeon]HIG03617.1 hypothetical protein [Candidatus Poseidoniales archaeon]HIK78255.1 hypothetical protein [Candidatus Poseidoniales archaeon]